MVQVVFQQGEKGNFQKIHLETVPHIGDIINYKINRQLYSSQILAVKDIRSPYHNMSYEIKIKSLTSEKSDDRLSENNLESRDLL